MRLSDLMRWPVACAIGLLAGAFSPPAIAEETDLGPMLDPRMIEHIAISADCMNVLILRRDEGLGSNILMMNGMVQDRGFIRVVDVSPDGKRLAWIRTFPKQSPALFTGHNEYLQFDGLIESPEGLKFSPDSRHLAFGARRGKDWFANLDGAEGPAGDGPPGQFHFSPDSRRLAYVFAKDSKKQVVVDGRKGDPYLDIRDLNFNADSVHLTYAACIAKDQWVAVVDGVVKSEAYASVTGLSMSRDGAHWGFSASRAKDAPSDTAYAVVMDGKITDSFNQYVSGPAFSEDGSHVTFVVTKKIGPGIRGLPTFEFVLNFDGNATETSDFPQEIAYSSDGIHRASILCRNFAVAAGLGDQRYVLSLDGKDLFGGLIAEENGYVGRPTFSPDSSRLAFAARIRPAAGQPDDYRWMMMVDGKKGQTYRSVAPAIFSPDSKHIAYAAQRENTWIMMLDGKELPYELLRPTVDGGPDGRWNTVPVPEIKSTAEIPWDGPRHEDFEVPQIPYCFDKNNKLNFIGVRDGKMFRVSVGGD